MTEAEKLCDDIFWGRDDDVCDICRRKDEYFCNNAMCLKECEWMVAHRKEKFEQENLFNL